MHTCEKCAYIKICACVQGAWIKMGTINSIINLSFIYQCVLVPKCAMAHHGFWPAYTGPWVHLVLTGAFWQWCTHFDNKGGFLGTSTLLCIGTDVCFLWPKCLIVCFFGGLTPISAAFCLYSQLELDTYFVKIFEQKCVFAQQQAFVQEHCLQWNNVICVIVRPF